MALYGPYRFECLVHPVLQRPGTRYDHILEIPLFPGREFGIVRNFRLYDNHEIPPIVGPACYDYLFLCHDLVSFQIFQVSGHVLYFRYYWGISVTMWGIYFAGSEEIKTSVDSNNGNSTFSCFFRIRYADFFCRKLLHAKRYWQRLKQVGPENKPVSIYLKRDLLPILAKDQ